MKSNVIISLFFKKCFVCNIEFIKQDKVVAISNDSYCHSNCVHCKLCRNTLTLGSKYIFVKNSIICIDSRCQEVLNNLLLQNFNDPNYFYVSESNLENFDSENDDMSSQTENSTINSQLPFNSGSKKPRNRTVFTEKQLYLLNTYYNINSKPDALSKDQLVEKTGLNSKVIRVWFQNKRCSDKKDKKRQSFELNGDNIDSNDLSNAVLLKAQSPELNSSVDDETFSDEIKPLAITNIEEAQKETFYNNYDYSYSNLQYSNKYCTAQNFSLNY